MCAIVDRLATRIAHVLAINVLDLGRLPQIETYRNACHQRESGADQARKRRGETGLANAERPAEDRFGQHEPQIP